MWIVGTCKFDVTKHDASGVEGTLDCPALGNMQDSDKTKKVKATGTFAAKR